MSDKFVYKRPLIPEDWCTLGEASRILKVHISAVNDVVVKHDVPHMKIEGMRVYNKSVLKMAAVKVAEMRRVRKARMATPQQEPQNV